MAIWYLKQEKSFSFLSDKNEVFSFLGTVFFIAILPFGIFYWLSEKEKHRQSARKLSVLGFLPAIIYLIYLLTLGRYI